MKYLQGLENERSRALSLLPSRRLSEPRCSSSSPVVAPSCSGVVWFGAARGAVHRNSRNLSSRRILTRLEPTWGGNGCF
jgi:hypothetical protein